MHLLTVLLILENMSLFFLDGCHVPGIQLVNQVLLYAVVMLC